VNSSEEKKSFCLAPWVHTFTGPDGQRQLCCISRKPVLEDEEEVYTFTDFKSYWNSDDLKTVRKKMLSNEPVVECKACDNELNPYKNYFNDQFADLRSNVLSRTSEDGTFNGTPVSVDYRIYHLCNFKCLMCNPHYSTSWESEIRQLGFSNALPAWLKEGKAATENFQKNVGPQELKFFVKEGNLTEIYWAGGEPLMSPIHWDVMNALIDTKQSKNVCIRYTTNLSRLKFKSYNFTDLLPHFKQVEIGVSLDACGKLGEYLRYGLKWPTWVEHLDQVLKTVEDNEHCKVWIDHRLTLPGLLGLRDLAKFANDKKILLRSKMVEGKISKEAISPLHPTCLPTNLMRPFVEKTLEDIVLVNKDGFADWTVALLEELLSQLSLQESFGKDLAEEALRNGLRNLLILDQNRFSEPKFLDWFKDTPEIYAYFRVLSEGLSASSENLNLNEL
jgi:hypothetical protein